MKRELLGDARPALPAPALGVFGWSGSGKTTVMEAVIPTLVARGLRVAVMKADVHGLNVDHPGKDSDRLFRAGADVLLGGPAESLLRTHRPAAESLPGGLAALLADHDLVLVEGNRSALIPKVWLASETEAVPPEGVVGILDVLPRDGDRPRRLLRLIDTWLPRAWASVPIIGGLLAGGRGRPEEPGLLEAVAATLAASLQEVVLLGDAVRPGGDGGSLAHLSDPFGAQGPLAGMLAAHRWAPSAAWLFCPCDLPDLQREAVEWLVAQRQPGRWVVLPRTSSGLEPLLGVFEPQARALLEQLFAAGVRAPRLVTDHPKVAVVPVPPELERCWRNGATAPHGGQRTQAPS